MGEGRDEEEARRGVRAVADTDRMGLVDGGGRYPVAVAPLAWVERQKFLASDAANGDQFGRSVSLYGNLALVGAEADADAGSQSGSAYIFVRAATSWMQQAKLVADDAAALDYLGKSVSLHGGTALVGASGGDDSGSNAGSAYVFVRTATVWMQQAKLVASDAEGGEYFGGSVSLAGDTALVGATFGGASDPNNINEGSAYVFVRTATNWTQQGELVASDGAAIDYFGSSLSLSGDIALVGAWGDDGAGSESGSAYVFVRSAGSWAQQDKFVADDGAAGDYFGSSVSLSGNTALVGAWGDRDSGSASGSAYIFVRSAASWGQEDKLVASGGAASDRFGENVSLYGDIALVGAGGADDLGDNAGSAYLFTRAATSWMQQKKLLASDGAAHAFFGRSVSINGDSALVGADLHAESGAAYLFALRLVDGQACSDAGACSSKFCADGYCCDGACDGACEVCSRVGLEGTCSLVSRGSDPVPSCGGYLCNGAVGDCPSDCAASEDCASGYRCSGATSCVPKEVDGQSCVADSICSSGHCVDGVCCSQACDEGCGSCVIAGSEGICTPLAAGQPGTPSCSPYLCAGGDTSCPTGCAEQGDCASGNHCAGGVCQPHRGQGAACTEDTACTTEFCTDGICCLNDGCGPYRCGPGGTCEAVCSSSAQCASGHACTSAGKCEPQSASGRAANESGSCHVVSSAAGGHRSARWPAVLGWLVCLGLVRRRGGASRGQLHRGAPLSNRHRTVAPSRRVRLFFRA